MSDCIKNDWELNELAQEYADDIRKDVEQYGGDFSDMAWERADGSEHVIYYYNAQQLCANCNTDEGEQFIDDMGGIPPGKSFDEIACMIAFGELYQRIMTRLYDMEVA